MAKYDVETAARVTRGGSCPSYREGKWVRDKRRANTTAMCRFAEQSPRNGAGWTWIPYLQHVPDISVRLSRCLQNKRVAFVGDGVTRDQFLSLVCILTKAAPLRTTSQFESFFTARDNITVTFIPSSFLLNADRDYERIAGEFTNYDVMVVGVFDPWWSANSSDINTLYKDRVRTWRMVTDVVPLLEGLAVGRSIVWRSSTPPPCSETTERVRAQLDQLNTALLRALSNNTNASLYLDVTFLTIEWVDRVNHQGPAGNCSHWCVPGVPDTWNEMLLAILCDECTPQAPSTPIMFPENPPIERAVAQFLLDRGPPTLEYYRLSWSPTALGDIERRRITLFMDLETELRFPMNWTQCPQQSMTFRMQLHSFVPAMQTFGTVYLNQSVDASLRHEAATLAKLMCLDWITQIPVTEDMGDMIWHDMPVGLRAGSLLFGLRMVLAEGLLSPKELARWLGSLKDHATWLMDDAHYHLHHNHGIFEDIGLFLLSQDLIMLPEASLWEQRSRIRFQENFYACVEWNEGIWLEHSSMYQLMMLELVRYIVKIGLGSAEFALLERRMSENLAWFYLPDGKMATLGDTAPGPYHEDLGGPRDVVNDTLKVFWKAGLGIARAAPHSVLYYVSWFHSRGHKHLDDLSITLFDLGERLLVHPGVFAYVTGPAQKYRWYVQSPTASNGLQVDDELRIMKGEVFYGSGLVASGWRERRSSSNPPSFALEAWNPRVQHTKGVTHHRTIYYHPMHTLVIVDRVRAKRPHRYTRYLHFGPAVTLRRTSSQSAIFEMEIVGYHNTRPPRVVESSTSNVSVSQVRGRHEPTVQGFVFPIGLEPIVPIDTLVMSCTTMTANFVVWIDLTGTRAPRVRLDHIHVNEKAKRTELLWTDGQSVILERQGSTLQITESSAA